MVPIQEIGTNTRELYQYTGLVRIQENCTNTRDWYEYKRTVPIHGIDTNTRKWYRYRRLVRIQESNAVLKNSISTCFKLFTIYKKRIIVELSSRQAIMQASVNSSEAKLIGAKLTYNTRRHHVRRGYRSRHG